MLVHLPDPHEEPALRLVRVQPGGKPGPPLREHLHQGRHTQLSDHLPRGPGAQLAILLSALRLQLGHLHPLRRREIHSPQSHDHWVRKEQF